MTKTAQRARYTLEFKQEAVRLVEGGQSIAAGSMPSLPQPESPLTRAGRLLSDPSTSSSTSWPHAALVTRRSKPVAWSWSHALGGRRAVDLYRILRLRI